MDEDDFADFDQLIWDEPRLFQGIHDHIPAHAAVRRRVSFPELLGSSTNQDPPSSASLPDLSGSLQTQFLRRSFHPWFGQVRHTVSSLPQMRVQRSASANQHIVRSSSNLGDHHRELLTRRNQDAFIFADTRDTRRIQLNVVGQHGPNPIIMPPEQGHHLEIPIPCLEPFAYAVWLTPLSLSSLHLLQEIPFFLKDDDIIIQTMGSIFASCLILSLAMEPQPAILYIEIGNLLRVTNMFYNHHFAALEALIVSQAIKEVTKYYAMSPMTQFISFISSFFGTFIFRQAKRRVSGMSHVSFTIGGVLLFIMVY